MVVSMRIIEAKDAPVVSAMDGVVDVRQVVPANDGLTSFPISPNLVAQQSTTGLRFEFEALLLEQDFRGRLGHRPIGSDVQYDNTSAVGCQGKLQLAIETNEPATNRLFFTQQQSVAQSVRFRLFVLVTKTNSNTNFLLTARKPAPIKGLKIRTDIPVVNRFK